MADVLHVEPDAADTYVGRGPRYPWGGLYGGQIVAQALRAAHATVDAAVRPHSLRAYFLRAGDHDEPVRYEVDRLRDGRSFATRRVVAHQAVGPILNLEASFTGTEGEGDARQLTSMPPAVGPDGADADEWTDLFERRVEPLSFGSGRANVWLRWAAPIGDDPLDHDVAFAFLSDDAPLDAIKTIALGATDPGSTDYVEFWRRWFNVSLDHTVWFHAPVRADDWLLHAFRCERFVGGRGLAIGEVFDRAGTHVATIAQEMLLRRHRAAQ